MKELQALRAKVDDLRASLEEVRALHAPGKRWLNYREAAALLDTTPGSLAVAVSKRQVPFVKSGRRTLFDRLALEAHLQAHSVPAEAWPAGGRGGRR